MRCLVDRQGVSPHELVGLAVAVGAPAKGSQQLVEGTSWPQVGRVRRITLLGDLEHHVVGVDLCPAIVRRQLHCSITVEVLEVRPIEQAGRR